MKVTLIVAQTLDGFIAQRANQVSTEWTSKADKDFFGKESKKNGVMVMGGTTYETMGRPLPARVSVVLTRDEELIAENNLIDLVDYAGPILADEEDEALLLSQWIKENNLDQKPYYTNLTPAEVRAILTDKGWPRLAVCGGASVYRQFLESGLVDELKITIEPVMFGEGIKLLGEGNSFNELKKYELKEVERISDQTTVLVLKCSD